MIGETHDAGLKSWVDSANDPQTDFPIQNLPFGIFRPGRIGVAIGDQILDLERCCKLGFESLNQLMALPPERWSELRLWLSRALRAGNRSRLSECLVPMKEAEMLLPAAVGDYTDFYASIDHATNVGRLFRPDNPLLPNYKYVPIAYHGRASSIVISGTPIRRPWGQTKTAEMEVPVYGPTQALDYEAEIGFFIGGENALGERVPIEAAERRIFGLCLVNDWSARDIQSWEYQPLGPFLSKSFATSISPWVVTVEALAPFRTAAYRRAPLPYLEPEGGGINLTLEAWIGTARLSRTNAKNLYWTMAQMVAHHASNGCNLRPGDLLASGTISGPGDEERGCLLELAPQRGFLEDGEEVILRGYCEREGFARIGFGECRGKIISPTS